MRYAPLNHEEVVSKVKDFIWKKRNFRRQDITANMVAEELGIARSSLLSIFKDDIGTTFLNYVNDCRIRHARKLVMKNYGRFSMEHIQAMSGFGSLHTFYSKYKEKYGELPTVTDANNIKNNQN